VNVDPSRTIVGGGGSGRDRGDRAVVGTAVPRPVYANVPVNPIYYPWHSHYYSPYGYYGYGYNYGYGYSPCGWSYGCPSWYNPYWAYPYGFGIGWTYPGYGYGYGGSGSYDPDPGYSSSGRRDNYDEPRRMGSIRLKAKPASAKVYINGSLVGTVDDFDGLTNHLELEEGAHELELRAEGYATLIKDINVKAGQTTTERISLKKK
jgi:hypothetical protein